LNNQVILTEANFIIEFESAFLIVTDLVDQRTINFFVDLFLLFKAMSDFLGEIQAEVTDSLTLEHLLWLIELLSHQTVEIIIKYKVLKLS